MISGSCLKRKRQQTSEEARGLERAVSHLLGASTRWEMSGTGEHHMLLQTSSLIFRGVTIDIATTHFATPHRNFTLLDAPGHRDFIPAMISGAAQADVALMVVDGSPGEFEAGFERGGQTREHAWLVRSLGVREIVVGINKMDLVSADLIHCHRSFQVDWSQDRYDEIVEALKPFLVSAGFSASKTTFIPIAAMEGTNVLDSTSEALQSWYSGPTLIQTLGGYETSSTALTVR